ncbi:MAG TPA: DUF4135 domain-containing protein, partial [Longimicrobium sp.]|nr:DUF4135 domain-containing protein [Longimicrobium sp.]
MSHQTPASTIAAPPADAAESAWMHALFLHERRVPDAASLPAAALEAARARARSWRDATGVDEETFRYRLATAGINWDDFVLILAAREAGVAPAASDERALDWVDVVDEIGRGTHAGVEVPRKRWINPDGSEGDAPPFGGFIHPFLQVAVGRFRQGAAELQSRHAVPLFESAVELQLVLHLIERLVKQCSGTLILELNVARLRGQLEGDTPEERFRYYAERHFTAERVLELLREYPVLARLMSVTVERWVETSLEFLGRFAEDRGALGPAGGELGTLRSVQVGVSDLHRGGRSVVIAEDVHGRRVVYKPVSLAVDARMERLVEGISGFGVRHPLRAPRVLDRGEYGWIEHVGVAGCDTEEELRRFYWRQGSLIALLHLVRGADFHHENLLACGEHPVLVDNEALFHHNRWTRAGAGTPYEEASAVMGESVLRQALLPFVFRFTQDARGVDNSGMG